jgi:diguanylate cyclase (GGDEF)-like protein/PAS domain S-box-containing protein
MVDITTNAEHASVVDAMDALRQICMANLLASREERVYFSDRMGRTILVSEGALAVIASGLSPAELVGKTGPELFGDKFAEAADADAEQILRTGVTIVGELKNVAPPNSPPMWFQTTKMPLRDADGAIVGTFGIARDLTAQIEAESALAHLALHDSLTGLPNRTLILDRLEQMLARARRQHLQCAVMFLDLDNFKDVNDTLGHQAGDQLLVAVSERLSGAVRAADTVGRLGGDEFVVLIEGESLSAGAEVIAERILDVLRTPFQITSSNVPISASASIGVALRDRQTSDDLLRDADIALYQAKGAGKHCAVVFAPNMQAEAQAHRKLSVDLEGALGRGEFFLLYQPTIDLQTNAFTGVEALLRWQHPERGVVEPDDFVPQLEASGLIVPVGAWVLEEACRQGASWHANGHRFSVSVNVSAKQVLVDRIIGDVERALTASGFDPSMLVLELTETTLMHDVDQTVARLSLLRAMGVRIAVDDFGTGYSSLGYLKQFPIDILKIDRSFVSGISDSAESSALVHTLVQLGRALHLETIAEGVEDDEQRLRLQAENVDTGQGFLFSRPIDVASIDRFLEAQVDGR